MSIVDLVSYIHLLITQGISMTAVLVRVVMGVSYDNTTRGTVNSMNLGRQTQLSPFTTKFNPTPEVRKSDSFE